MAHDPESSFLDDMKGIYDQHAAMWSVYTESIKLLVTVTSLPILAASALIALGKDGHGVDLADVGHLPLVLICALLLTPVVDFFLLGVVIHHRLVILFYARGLNGYRKIYLEEWNHLRAGKKQTLVSLPMPTDAAYPNNYEPKGPMGLIVHGCALVNALYVLGASYALTKSWCLPVILFGMSVLLYEWWYRESCVRGAKSDSSAPIPPAQQA